MTRTIRHVGGWQFWLTAERNGTDWEVRILHASNGDVRRFRVSGDLSERAAHNEAWNLSRESKRVGNTRSEG